MGAPGWLARRVLSIVLFPVLVAFWYGLLVYIILLPPGFLGFKENAMAEVVLVSLAAAFVTDLLIVRSVKRATAPGRSRSS